MLDNNKVQESIIEHLGEQNITMLSKFLIKHKTPFPTIVIDHVPISMRLQIQTPLNNYINKKFDAVPNHIKDWITFEDYIYNMVLDIIKENNK